jgi:hypothetical protein
VVFFGCLNGQRKVSFSAQTKALSLFKRVTGTFFEAERKEAFFLCIIGNKNFSFSRLRFFPVGKSQFYDLNLSLWVFGAEN